MTLAVMIESWVLKLCLLSMVTHRSLVEVKLGNKQSPSVLMVGNCVGPVYLHRKTFFNPFSPAYVSIIQARNPGHL